MDLEEGWPLVAPGEGTGSQGNEHDHEHCCRHLLSCRKRNVCVAIQNSNREMHAAYGAQCMHVLVHLALCEQHSNKHNWWFTSIH